MTTLLPVTDAVASRPVVAGPAAVRPLGSDPIRVVGAAAPNAGRGMWHGAQALGHPVRQGRTDRIESLLEERETMDLAEKAVRRQSARVPDAVAPLMIGSRRARGPSDGAGTDPLRRLRSVDARFDGGLWVRELSAGDSRSTEPACSASTVQEFTGRLGRPAVGWAVGTAHEIVEGIVVALPQFGRSPVETTALRMGVEAGAFGILASILSGRVLDPDRSPEMRQSAQVFVHRGISLPEVWASVRHGHKELMRRLIAACSELVPASEQVAEITQLTTCAFEFVNSLAEDLGQAYTEESERWITTAASVRAETVEKILAADLIDLEAAALTLRFEIKHRHHVAIVVSQTEAHGDGVRLQTAAHRWLERAGADQTLLIPQGRSHVWAWGNRTVPFPGPLPQLDGPDEAGIAVAVGRPARDVDGFRTSHSEAQIAHRVIGMGAAGGRTVVDFPSVSLIGLLTEDERMARQFVASELGALADDGDPRIRDLRQTLLVYLETGSAKATAARLFVVRNTVAYRLARAAELLGRPITDRPLELWVALLLSESLDADGAAPAPSG